MDKAILIDGRGYFLGAYQWSGDAPDFLKGFWPLPTQRRRPKEDRLYLITNPEKLNAPNETARWNFREEVWELPTEERWLVQERRDRPGFFNLKEVRTVWPENLPAVSAGQMWVDTPPPADVWRKPLWDGAAMGWVFPVSLMPVDPDGTVQPAQLYLRAEDAVGDHIDPTEWTVTDEQGEQRHPRPGDVLDLVNGVALEVRVPNYPQYPIQVFKTALQNATLLADFVAFLQAQGFTVEDFDEVEKVGLDNVIIRQFLVAQGITIQQAKNSLNQAAEQLLKEKLSTNQTLREKEK